MNRRMGKEEERMEGGGRGKDGEIKRGENRRGGERGEGGQDGRWRKVENRTMGNKRELVRLPKFLCQGVSFLDSRHP